MGQRAQFHAVVARAFGLAREGKLSAKGMPSPLQLAVMASRLATGKKQFDKRADIKKRENDREIARVMRSRR